MLGHEGRETAGGGGVALCGGNHVRRVRREGGDRGARPRRHVEEEVLAPARAGLEERVRDDPLVVHDVAEAPPAARPRVREVHLRP